MFLLLALISLISSWICVIKIDIFDKKFKRGIALYLFGILFAILDFVFCALHFIL